MDVTFNKAAAAYGNTSKVAQGFNSGAEETTAASGPSFSDLIKTSLNNALDTTYKAESVSAKALVDKADLSDLVTAISSAELTLNTVVAVRDRVINAYHDIIKMPI